MINKDKYCKYCGKKIPNKEKMKPCKLKKRRFCDRKCSGKFSGFKKNSIPWNKDKTGVYTEETLEIMRENSTGVPSKQKGKVKHKTEPKYCLYCDGKIIKKVTESYDKFKIRKFCNLKCYYKYPKSDKTKEKMSKSGKNRILTDEHKQKIGIGNKNKKRTKKQKELSRILKINELKNKHGICHPNYNPIACVLFDKLNIEFGLNLCHAENGGEVKIIGYFVDAYDIENNIIIEYDEKHHNSIVQKKKDEIRQSNLIEKTGCTFIRIKQCD